MKLHDFQCSKCSHPAHLPFSVQWSDDDNVAVATEKGVYITALQPSPKNKAPVLHTTRSYVPCSKVSPTEHCGIDLNELIKDFDQHYMYQLVEDITISPVFKNSTYVPSVKQIAWSPVVNRHKLKCLLGMLSDSGFLNLCYQWREKWETDASLSQAWHTYCSSQWREPPADSKEAFEELKRRAYQLKLSAFSWGSVLDKDWYLLFSGTMDGTLAIWKMKQDPDTKKLTVNLLDVLPSVEAYRSPVTAMYCHCIEEGRYMLIVCYLDGRITNVAVSLVSDSIETLSHHDIWDDYDKIQVYPGGIIAKITSTGHILTVIKGSFILIFTISHSGEFESYVDINTEELLITGLAELTPSKLLIAAYSGVMYTLDVNKSVPRLSRDQNSLRGSHYSCNGLALSKSKAIAVIPYS